MRFLFTVLILNLLRLNSYTQALVESFESGLPTSYTSTTSYTLSSGTWTGQANGVIRGSVGVIDGSYTCQLRSQTGAQITSPAIPTGGIGTITFYVSASTASGALQVNYSTNGGSSWTPATGSPFTGIGTSGSYLTATVNNSSSNIMFQFYRTGATIYIDDILVTAAPLPIKVKTFDIVKTNNKSKLMLTTTSETNNDYFTIERSSDGISFDAIGEIKGAGNSSSELKYEFVDENPLPGINYYRIKQTDFDGKYSYTEIKSVRHQLGQITVSPHRTDGRLQITSTQDTYDVVMYSTAGQEVYRMKGLSGDQTLSIESLQAGIYIVKILDHTFKIVKY